MKNSITNILVMNNKENNKQRLFDMLIGFGFTKIESDKHIYFSNNINGKDEIFIFPNSGLQAHHYIYARKQLDMNGWLDEDDFNEKFGLNDISSL